MRQILFILASLQFTVCHGQTDASKQDETGSKDYLNIVYELCPRPDILEVESTTDGYVEVEYLCDGKRYELGIRNNTLLFSEHSVAQSEIPLDIITRKLEKKYQGWTLDEVSLVETKDTSFLKVEILKEGIEQNLYFTTDGKWYKIKPIEVSSIIDFTAIEKNSMYKSANYKFHKPDSVYEMPDLLKEVSGIALSSDHIVYCIQDEIGSIFAYDLQRQEITNSYRFTDIGDFEDLAIHKNIVYVLRSDGNLFVYDFKNKTKTSQTMLQTNSLNIEGICFGDGYIYIACKDALVNHAESKRMIYRVKTTRLDDVEPYLEINIDEMSTFLTENYPELGITKVLFNPSSIAIHPITNEMFILSATDRFIAIYRDKQLINIIPLSADIYFKPEGLSFYDNGDLLLSSEGDKKGFVKGSISVIQYK